MKAPLCGLVAGRVQWDRRGMPELGGRGWDAFDEPVEPSYDQPSVDPSVYGYGENSVFAPVVPRAPRWSSDDYGEPIPSTLTESLSPDDDEEWLRLPEIDPASGSTFELAYSPEAMPVSRSLAEWLWEGDARGPSEPPHDADDEPEPPDVIGRFFQEIIDSGKEELCWRIAKIIAEAHLPGAGMALVDGIRNLRRVVTTIDTFDRANGIEVDVPIGAIADLPIDLSMAATYSDGPDAGRFSLAISGSVSLDGPPERFVPEIRPAVTSQHETRDRRHAAVDSPGPAESSWPGELGDQDHSSRRPPRPYTAPHAVRSADLQTVQLHGQEAKLITVAGHVTIIDAAKEAAPGATHTKVPSGAHSMVVGRLAARTAPKTAATEPLASTTPPIVLLVVDARRRRAAVFYCDAHGWVHLAAVLFVDGQVLRVFVQTSN